MVEQPGGGKMKVIMDNDEALIENNANVFNEMLDDTTRKLSVQETRQQYKPHMPSQQLSQSQQSSVNQLSPTVQRQFGNAKHPSQNVSQSSENEYAKYVRTHRQNNYTHTNTIDSDAQIIETWRQSSHDAQPSWGNQSSATSPQVL